MHIVFYFVLEWVKINHILDIRKIFPKEIRTFTIIVLRIFKFINFIKIVHNNLK